MNYYPMGDNLKTDGFVHGGGTATIRLWKDEAVIAEIEDCYMNQVLVFDGEVYAMYSCGDGVYNYTWVMCQNYKTVKPSIWRRLWSMFTGS